MAGCYGEGKPEYEIIEYKPRRNVVGGFAQNIIQLGSSFQTNKRKRKREMSMILTISMPLTKVQCDKEKAKLISN
ncbi:hypothetical protein GLOIN_2v1727104 [Rhizophagus irregularis DAOM 181602=DAOM 197198]|nr:hypothetical protein GLOIN_2v1727104 [Rhizophagus irregularis DAOM 181602=DAOM 197198]